MYHITYTYSVPKFLIFKSTKQGTCIIDTEISPESSSFSDFVKYNLNPNLNDFRIISVREV